MTRAFTLLLLTLTVGCQPLGSSLTVVGSAYVESDRPEGKAVAKLEVRYSPAAREAPPREAPTDAAAAARTAAVPQRLARLGRPSNL